jgi:hypothetical protein
MSDTHVITAVEWNQGKQAFIVSISVAQEIIDGADFFELRTRIRIVQPGGAVVDVIDPKTDGIVADGGADNLGLVPLSPVIVPWDRKGGAFAGNANVKVGVSIQSNRERLTEKGVQIA